MSPECVLPQCFPAPALAGLTLLLVWSLLSLAALAGPHDPARPSPASTSQPWTLNGSGERTMLGFSVYQAALYLPEPMRDVARVLDERTPRRLHVTLLRDTTTEQNLDALRAGLEDNNSAAELEVIKAEIELFFTLIQLDYQPQTGTVLSIGGRTLGRIPGERFNRAVMKIWLGERPIQASLKRALLGMAQPVM